MRAEPRTTRRQIGPFGTAARALVGTTLVALAIYLKPHAWSVVLGLIGLPLIVVAALMLRGRNAPPLRLHEPAAHCANITVGVILLVTVRDAALLFYGSAMLLAAWHGMGACELFAVSNALRGRDDQLGCPLFLPVDAAESAPRTHV